MTDPLTTGSGPSVLAGSASEPLREGARPNVETIIREGGLALPGVPPAGNAPVRAAAGSLEKTCRKRLSTHPLPRSEICQAFRGLEASRPKCVGSQEAIAVSSCGVAVIVCVLAYDLTTLYTGHRFDDGPLVRWYCLSWARSFVGLYACWFAVRHLLRH